MEKVSVSSLIIASALAIFAVIIVMLAMPTVQPVLVSVATSVGVILTTDGQPYADAVNDLIVPIAPVVTPILVFVLVLYKMGFQRRPD